MIPTHQSQLGRRALLKGALALTGGVALAGLAGCSSDRSTAGGTPAGSVSGGADASTGTGGPSSAPAGTTASNTLATSPATSGSTAPHRGGQLRVVAIGTSTPNLNPLTATDGASYMAIWNIYDQLVMLDGGTVVNSLATALEPNADATSWTVTIRSGASFHDGRPVTAADVVYSLQTFGDPQRSPSYGALYVDMDLANITALDATTVRIPLHRARGDLVETVLSQLSLVFPAGTTDADWAKGIGSGPFRLASASSSGTVLEASPDYWGGAPLLDGASFSGVADPTARLNAVRSGQADLAVDITPTGARSAATSGDVQILRGGASNSVARTFEMNTGKDPFTDATVREALKLLVDRQQLVDNILLGQGQVGNDLFGLGLAGYNSALPQRERDVDKARALLSAAGVSELTVVAADLVSGTVDAANLLAEQARDAGLTITVQQADGSTYFNDFAGVLATPLQGFYFVNRPAASLISTYTGSRSTFNVTAMTGSSYDAMLTAAQSTVDDSARAQKFDDLQRYLWENGGDLVWGFAEVLDAVRPGVGGIQVIQSYPMLAKAYLPR